MTPGRIRKKVVAERFNWVREMLANIRSLPFQDPEIFQKDHRNFASAESYLRRGLEALLDIGRHILAKGFARPVAEYKEIPRYLQKEGVISQENAKLFTEMAGYRNRMVHFYHEITEDELYRICTQELTDIEAVLNGFMTWIKQHPEKIDDEL